MGSPAAWRGRSSEIASPHPAWSHARAIARSTLGGHAASATWVASSPYWCRSRRKLAFSHTSTWLDHLPHLKKNLPEICPFDPSPRGVFTLCGLFTSENNLDTALVLKFDDQCLTGKRSSQCMSPAPAELLTTLATSLSLYLFCVEDSTNTGQW